MDGRKNNGGKRENSGRPRKDAEDKIVSLLDKHIDRDIVVLQLLKKIKEGDTKAITLYFNYVYGRPINTVNQTTTLTVNDVDISKLIKFEDKDDKDK